MELEKQHRQIKFDRVQLVAKEACIRALIAQQSEDVPQREKENSADHASS